MGWTFFVVGVASGIAGGIVVAFLLHRRSVREVRTLLARLEELESTEVVAGQTVPEKLQETPVRPTADVLAGMTSHIRQVLQRGGGSLADQAIVCVHRHLGEAVTPAEIADELYVSLRSLERGLASSLDCTPSQLIVAMKMREAYRLLSTGEHRVNEVANRLGFSSPGHFSRRFRLFYKVTPSEVARSTR